MARPRFDLRPGGGVDVTLSTVEADAIRRIATDLIDELGDPGDPGLRRLFPPAYEDDRDLQDSFVEMTRNDLERGKVAAAQKVIASIRDGARRRGRWSATLDDETARCWLGVLNDARLVLGTRLDITEETYEGGAAPDAESAPLFDLYLYLGMLEEMLVEALLEGVAEGGAGPE